MYQNVNAQHDMLNELSRMSLEFLPKKLQLTVEAIGISLASL